MPTAPRWAEQGVPRLGGPGLRPGRRGAPSCFQVLSRRRRIRVGCVHIFRSAGAPGAPDGSPGGRPRRRRGFRLGPDSLRLGCLSSQRVSQGKRTRGRLGPLTRQGSRWGLEVPRCTPGRRRLAAGTRPGDAGPGPGSTARLRVYPSRIVGTRTRSLADPNRSVSSRATALAKDGTLMDSMIELRKALRAPPARSGPTRNSSAGPSLRDSRLVIRVRNRAVQSLSSSSWRPNGGRSPATSLSIQVSGQFYLSRSSNRRRGPSLLAAALIAIFRAPGPVGPGTIRASTHWQPWPHVTCFRRAARAQHPGLHGPRPPESESAIGALRLTRNPAAPSQAPAAANLALRGSAPGPRHQLEPPTPRAPRRRKNVKMMQRTPSGRIGAHPKAARPGPAAP